MSRCPGSKRHIPGRPRGPVRCSPLPPHNARSHLRVPGSSGYSHRCANYGDRRGPLPATGRRAGRSPTPLSPRNETLLRWARDRAREAGLRSVSPGTGAALRLLAATADAKAVAEIGTGTGVSGIYLLHGMRPDGVLTTVDPEPERQQFAREAFRAAGFAAQPGPLHPRPRPGRTAAARGRRLRPRLLRRRPARSAWTTSLNRCACCAPAAWSASRASSPTAARSTPPRSRPRCCGCANCCAPCGRARTLMPTLLPVGDGLLCAVRRG